MCIAKFLFSYEDDLPESLNQTIDQWYKKSTSGWHPSNFDLLMKFIIPFSYLYFESVYRQNQTKTEPSFHFHGESVVKCIYK